MHPFARTLLRFKMRHRSFIRFCFNFLLILIVFALFFFINNILNGRLDSSGGFQHTLPEPDSLETPELSEIEDLVLSLGRDARPEQGVEEKILAEMDPRLKGSFGKIKKTFSYPINYILYFFPSLGEAQWSQFTHFKNEVQGGVYSPRKSIREIPFFEQDRYVHVHYQLRYTLDCRDRNKVYLIGTINETKYSQDDHSDRPKPTQGGSSFLVMANGENFGHTLCTVHDHFNGQYSWLCPFGSHVCANVKISFTSVNFDSFRGYSHRFQLKRLDQEICTDQAHRHSHCAMPHTPITGTWKKSVYNSYDQKNLTFDVMNPAQLHTHCSCAKKFNKIIIFAAAEEAIKYKCINQACNKSWNIEFHLLSAMESELQFYDIDQNDEVQFVFLDLSLWEHLLNNGPQYLLEDFVTVLEPQLEKLVRIFHARNIAIISTTASPENAKDGSQNNVLLAAVAYAQRALARKFSIGFVDLFDPTYTMYSLGQVLNDYQVSYFSDSGGFCDHNAAAVASYAKILHHLCFI